MSAILNITKTIQYFKIKSCLHFEALFPFWKNNLDLIKKVRFESTTRQLYFNKSNQRKILGMMGNYLFIIFIMYQRFLICLVKYAAVLTLDYLNISIALKRDIVCNDVLPMEIGKYRKFLNNNAIHAALLANCFLQNFTLLTATSRWNSFIRI